MKTLTGKITWGETPVIKPSETLFLSKYFTKIQFSRHCFLNEDCFLPTKKNRG
jgi:hypothetical protein